MLSRPELSLIFPAFNEAERIEGTVREAIHFLEKRGISFEILVAADGEDGSREKVARMAESDPRLKVMGNAKRSGKGRGIREAVAIAQGRFIGFADADNKTEITEFDRVYPLLQAGVAVVIGSRIAGGSEIQRPQALYRRVGSRVFNYSLRWFVGIREIPDTQCGFKFFQNEVAKKLFQIQKIDGYMFDVEILFLARKLGMEIVQVPVRWRDDGDSRLQLLSGNLQNLKDVIRLRFSHRTLL